MTRPPHFDPDDDAAPAAVDDFIERMGVMIQAEGLPRIAGRILALLIIQGGPLPFGELAARLQVSRASVSTNSRLLESLGMIERISRPGKRGDHFRLAASPYRRMLEGAIVRMARTREVVSRAVSDIPDDWRGAHARLAELSTFYELAENNARALVEAMKEQGRG